MNDLIEMNTRYLPHTQKFKSKGNTKFNRILFEMRVGNYIFTDGLRIYSYYKVRTIDFISTIWKLDKNNTMTILLQEDGSN